MSIFKQIVEIKDRPWNRAVKVTITAPTFDGVDVQSLAQKAWRSPTKKMVAGPITLKVEAFGRGCRMGSDIRDIQAALEDQAPHQRELSYRGQEWPRDLLGISEG